MPRLRSHLFAAMAMSLVLTLHGCGFGTFGFVSAAAGGGGSTNAPSTPAGLLVIDGKVSPARIRIVLTDAEADAANVEFFYVLPADGVERALEGLAANPVNLSASTGGVEHELSWDFASEAGLDTAYHPGVQLIARVGGGVSQTTVVGLGNDAPIVEVREPDAEGSGVVPIRIDIGDSSDDPVDIRIEWALATTPGTRAIARPAGLDPSAPTPEFAFRSVLAPSTKEEVLFFWDTDSPRGDLIDLEREVVLSVTLIDPAGAETTGTTLPFVIDNNDPPTVQVGEGLVLNPDGRRGIPIPYTAADPESDPVRMVFQWRRLEEPTFPDLGTSDPAALATLLQDPAFVHEKHVCVPYRAFDSGMAEPVGPDSVRLPELRSGAASQVAIGGLEFGTLDLLRDSTIRSLRATWSQNQLSRPTAALPIGDGIRALVLGGQGATSSLHEVDLATGAATPIVTGLAGTPSALAIGPYGKRALVATDLGSNWQLYAVELVDGTVTTLLTGLGTGAVGTIRGLMPAGDAAALATVGGSLWRLSWSGAGSVVRLRGNLGTPWGLASDPLRPGRVLIAERDANRVLSFDLETLALEPIPTNAGLTLTAPTSIAVFDRGAGPQLLALCNGTVSGQRRVLAQNLGVEDAAVFALTTVADEATTVAVGPDGLVMVTLPVSEDLAVGGGIEQRREIAAVDLAATTITVSTPFAPAVRPLQRWRIGIGQPLFGPIRATPDGVRGVFVWDCRDAGPRVGVLIRATSVDTEFGGHSDSTIAAAIDNVDVDALPTGVSPLGMAAADLDGDGDLDVVVPNASNDTVSVFIQEGPRTFTALTPVPTASGPRSIAVADLDGDGDLDFVTGNLNGNSLTVCYQVSPAVFSPEPPLATGSGPISVAIADLDGDRDLDLVCCNQNDSNLTVFIQTGYHVFTAQPTVATGARPWWVTSADLDGDGDLDLISADFDGDSLTLLVQGPPGTFTTQQTLAAGDGPQSVAAADLDGDGDIDLACASSFSNEVIVFFQDAPLTFTPAAALAGDFPKTVIAVDLDDDGDLDLAATNGLANTVSLYFQEAPRAFSAQQRLATGSFPSALAAADVDGDGCVDLVCTNNDNSLQFFYMNGARRVTAQPALPSAAFAEGIAVGDLDGDGDLDLIAGNPARDQVTIYYQDAPRTFTPQAPLDAGNEPNVVAIADLDGDGDLDFVSANALGNDLTVFFQDSPRVFTAQPPLAVGDRPLSVIAADLDGDGDVDLACGNYSSQTVTLLFQDSSRAFPAEPAITNVPVIALHAADLDGDGDVDLVAADGNNLKVLFQDAPRSFTSLAVAGGRGYGVGAADLDGNGTIDLFTANLPGENVQLFYQDAPRVFTAATPLPAGSQTNSVAAGDLDGDGDLDLVCTNNSSNDLMVFFQDSPRVFTQQPPLATGSGPRRVTLADMDRDGDLDVICVVGGTNQILVMFGRR
ncbi:MAG: VCBS repeat-containing protein [Planctomycetes bacterium]|nr:VCBS repeat-containing protein [Planctomycetota bacterium]